MQLTFSLLVGVFFASATPTPAPIARLDQQLAAISTDTALVYPSQAIDEYPLWSPDGGFLAVNDTGEWKKIALAEVQLAGATWRAGQVLGVIQNRSAVTNATPQEVARWQRTNRMNPRQATIGRIVVQLREAEVSTALVITRPGNKNEGQCRTRRAHHRPWRKTIRRRGKPYPQGL